MTPERDVELKACPFCGGEATPAMAMNMQGTRYYHQCNNCNMQGPDSATREGRDAAWNARAALSQGRATTAEGDAELLLPLDRFFIATVEFLNDWKKGDFDLPTLAACDAESIRSHQTAAYHALQNIASALATLQAERDAAVAALEAIAHGQWRHEVDSQGAHDASQILIEIDRIARAALSALRAAALKGDARGAVMVDCPALHVRKIDKGYPFGDRVPKTIRMKRRVTSDLAWLLGTAPLAAMRGHDFPAWTNSYGAVAAVLPTGDHLGVKPGEFEVIEWHDPKGDAKPATEEK